ncbi:MAG: hypothetical protein HKN12_00890, partial [Gemmatimonadetes bacterium]|nr:hypothetical protein [Gemmatimonadota bacterium]
MTLRRVGNVATAAVAEIEPGRVVGGTSASFRYVIRPTIQGADIGYREIGLGIPAGFTDVELTRMTVGGADVAPDTATVGGEFLLTLAQRETRSLAVIVDFRATAPEIAGMHDFTARLADGNLEIAAAAGNADNDPDNGNRTVVETLMPQGIVLRLDVETDRDEVLVGEPLRVTFAVRNLGTDDVVDVQVAGDLPAHLKLAGETVWVDGVETAVERSGNGFTVALGTVPGREAPLARAAVEPGPGEAGYREIVFRAITGAGAKAGELRINARAFDYCDVCDLAEAASAEVRVGEDAEFERSTVIGKVFEDLDGDGRQDDGESGIGFARIVMDDGTYVVTDRYGRFHVPYVAPGQRVLKLDVESLGPGGEVVGDATRIVRVTPGLLARVNFAVRITTVTEVIGREPVPGVAIVSLADDHGIDVLGNIGMLRLLVNGTEVSAPTVRLSRRGDRLVTEVDAAEPVRNWAVLRHGAVGGVEAAAGTGPVPATIAVPEGGAREAYRLEVVYGDGTRVASPWVGPGDVISGIAAAPAATVAGREVRVDGFGRFTSHVTATESARIRVALEDTDGRRLERDVIVPTLTLHEVRSEQIVATDALPEDGLLGWTDPRNVVEVDGAAIPLGPDGAIVVPMGDDVDRATHAVVVRTPEGITRIVNLNVAREEHDASGARWVAQEGVPEMLLELPEAGLPMRTPQLRVTGSTTPGNRVEANGQPLAVDASGRISGNVQLQPGLNPVEFRVHDPAGQT